MIKKLIIYLDESTYFSKYSKNHCGDVTCYNVSQLIKA